MAPLSSLTGKLRKSQRAKISRRAANMPKTMKAAGRRQTMKAIKSNLAAAGGRFLKGYKRGGGPFSRLYGNGDKSGSGMENTLSMLGGSGSTSMPSMSSPERVNSPNSATVSYLSKQIRQLATVAASIGAITRDQQEALAAQINEANRQSKEALSESGAQLIQNEPVNSIGPGRDIIADFYKAISELNTIIEDKVRDKQDNSRSSKFLDAFAKKTGLDGIREESKARSKQARTKRGIEFDERRGAYVDKKTGRTVKESDALKNFKKVDPSNLRTRTGRIAQAEAVTKPGLMSRGLSSITSKLSGIVGTGAKGAAKRAGGAILTGGKAGKDAIAKLAGPLVKSALGKTALKSIPIVGALAGGAFAIGRLMDGDVVGAGLEAASGLAGPLTAIPALVASLSRDVYSSAFGVNPETDPMFGPRMGLVSTVVGGLVKQWMGTKVKSSNENKQTTTATNGGAPALKTTAPPKPSEQTQQVKKPAITNTGGAPSSGMSATKQTPPATKGAGAGPTSQGMSTASKTTKSAAASAALQPGKMPESPTPKGNLSSAPAPVATPITSPAAAAGAKITSASTDSSQSASMTSSSTSAPSSVPSTSPTTRSGAKGTGDVPDPSYSDISSFAAQLYFGSNVLAAG